MKRLAGDWYEHALYYDIAFDWDNTEEVDFIERMFRAYAQMPIRRIYEPFCGAGRLAVPLAQRGYEVIGADVSVPMLTLGRQKADAAVVADRIQVHTADVCAFAPSPPADAVVTMIDSFRHLQTEAAARQALQRWRAGLVEGGVLIIGLAVGEPPIEADLNDGWTMTRDGISVHAIVFEQRQPGLQPGTSLQRSQLCVATARGDEFEIVSDDPMRTYSVGSLSELVRIETGLCLQATHDYHDLDRRIDVDNPSGNVVCVFA